jgi:tungstate transport system substrate-binding protein
MALAGSRADAGRLRLATTTSTADSGLLAALLPDFERRCGCMVDVLAVGTGQALALGEHGDADVVLVHDREAEDRFVAAGHAKRRLDVMYNDFILVGPSGDPAGVRGSSRVADAFRAIARKQAAFVSRGDRSGTHSRELQLWQTAGIRPAADMAWYRSLGQGMGETLVAASEQLAYTLADRGTWLSMRRKLPGLAVLVGGERLSENREADLLNRYGVIVVDPVKHPGVNSALAERFVDWLTSPDTQKRIGAFGLDRFGQPLFYPDADRGKATSSINVVVFGRSQILRLADLQALPKRSLSHYTVVGVKRGTLGTFSWSGASLEEILVRVNPDVRDKRYAASRITITSSDAWTVVLKWPEIFGTLKAGEALYTMKGCNECHGIDGEGTAPAAKRPAPRLSGRTFDLATVRAILAAGGDRHAGLNGYTPAQLSQTDLEQLLAWLARPGAPQPPVVRGPAQRLVLLAYEKDGRAIDGSEGLIQLVVGADQFAGRYSHWVASIRVQ